MTKDDIAHTLVELLDFVEAIIGLAEDDEPIRVLALETSSRLTSLLFQVNNTKEIKS